MTGANPLRERPGFVAAEGKDAGIAAHYGDPMREQRLLVEGLAVVDQSHRSVLTVTGPDRLSWLNSLTTAKIVDLAPGVSAETLILSPKGHIEHSLAVVDDGETTWCITEPGAGAEISSWLTSMKFMLRVNLADRTAEFAVFAEPTSRPAAPGEPVTWCDPWPGLIAGGASYASVAEADHPGRQRSWRLVVVPRANVATFIADRPAAGLWAAEALRIAAWRPRCGVDTDHRTIVHEVDWLRTAVHLNKGCYRGQETVARVHNLGRPPRRLVLLHLDGSGHQLPDPGAEVLLADRKVGQLMSVARHYELGPIALALVKRAVDPTAPLLVTTIAAAQEVIVAP